MAEIKKYYGNYLGIVIQNNDPEHRGRVKVYVPHIAAVIYENWNKDFATLEDKYFVFPDKDNAPDLDKILPYLKQSLPWAEQASPLFGGNASGRYNAYTRQGSTSDSNFWKGDKQEAGFRPLQNYVGENRVNDAFIKTNNVENKLVNPNAYQYQPADYSNLARGEFTIPNVGAHVWVFFIDGDPNFPVIWATSFGEEDWKRIFSLNKDTTEDFVSTDYPSSYENLAVEDKQGGIDHNVKTFRSKHVFNSNKHSFEFVDTDLNELIKLTHFSGSFLEFNNKTTSRLATKNDQVLVLGDQFITIRKNQAIYIAQYQETIIEGDRILKLGNFEKRKGITQQIYSILKDSHNYKRLFEIMRSPQVSLYTSTLQSQNGMKANCPVCGGTRFKLGSDCITCSGTGLSPSSQWGTWDDEPLKWDTASITVNEWNGFGFTPKTYSCTQLEKIIFENQQKINQLELEGEFGNGGDDSQIITGNITTTVGTTFNDLESFRIDPVGKIRNEGIHIAREGLYVSMAAAPMIEYVDVDSLPGGDWDIVCGNKYRLNVGSKGIHIKTTGPLNLCGTIMNITGEAIYMSAGQEMLLDGNKHLEMRADVINIKPKSGERSKVLVEGNLGVANNLAVMGGVHSEGELTYLHSTAPKVPYMTEVGFGPVAHTHVFFAPPWTLLPTCDEVREVAAGNNQMRPSPNMKRYGFWMPG